MLTRAGHVEIMEDEKLPKTADARKVEGNGDEEDRQCDEGLYKRGLERVGEARRKEKQTEGIGDC